MRDLVFFALTAVAVVTLIALALVWPAGDAGKGPVPPPVSTAAATR